MRMAQSLSARNRKQFNFLQMILYCSSPFGLDSWLSCSSSSTFYFCVYCHFSAGRTNPLQSVSFRIYFRHLARKFHCFTARLYYYRSFDILWWINLLRLVLWCLTQCASFFIFTSAWILWATVLFFFFFLICFTWCQKHARKKNANTKI